MICFYAFDMFLNDNEFEFLSVYLNLFDFFKQAWFSNKIWKVSWTTAKKEISIFKISLTKKKEDFYIQKLFDAKQIEGSPFDPAL